MVNRILLIVSCLEIYWNDRPRKPRLNNIHLKDVSVKTTSLSSKLTSYKGYFFKKAYSPHPTPPPLSLKKYTGIYKDQSHSSVFFFFKSCNFQQKTTQCIRILTTACEVRLSLIFLDPEFWGISMHLKKPPLRN